jgi:ribosomal protein L37AE/L43A
MGNILIAQCFNKDCKSIFLGELYVGGGFDNEVEKCNVPYFCDSCGEITIDDFLLKSQKCKKCNKKLKMYGEIIKIFEDDETENNDKPPIIYYIPEKEMVFEWQIGLDRIYLLEKKRYRCPCCKKDELEFWNNGMWD